MSLEKLKEETQELIEKIRSRVCDVSCMTLCAAWAMIQDAIVDTVLSIERNIGNSLAGPEKKAKAMEGIGDIIDIVVVLIDVPMVPEFIEAWVDKYLKMFLLSIADGSIDAIVNTFHKLDVFPDETEPDSNKEGTK